MPSISPRSGLQARLAEVPVPVVGVPKGFVPPFRSDVGSIVGRAGIIAGTGTTERIILSDGNAADATLDAFHDVRRGDSPGGVCSEMTRFGW